MKADHALQTLWQFRTNYNLQARFVWELGSNIPEKALFQSFSGFHKISLHSGAFHTIENHLEQLTPVTQSHN